MGDTHRTLFVTDRGPQQQQWALDGAPPELDIIMRRRPSKEEIIALLRERTFIDYLEYLEAQETLEEALIAFFCLLELIKSHLVIAVQEQLFHSIKVWLRKDGPRMKAS